MKVRILTIAVILIAVLCLAGPTVLASNMGFKVDISQPKGAQLNMNFIAVPYNFPDVNSDLSVTAADLRTDMGGATYVANVQRWDPATESWKLYTGRAAQDFALIPGEGYLIQVNTSVSYVCVGTHDPSATVSMLKGAQLNMNFVSVPYHSMCSMASDLRTEMGGATYVANIQRWDTATESWKLYTGRAAQDFAITPGEALLVQVNTSFTWTPSHY
jgi:hypothetical protein